MYWAEDKNISLQVWDRPAINGKRD